MFVNLGCRDHFNIPKLHSLRHYVESIRNLDTLDGLNIEHSKRLHIDYAKKAYVASSWKDYVIQMTKWLQRQEAIGNCMGIPWGTGGQTHTHTHQKPIPTTMGTIPMVSIPTCTHIYQCIQAHFLICCCKNIIIITIHIHILIRRLV